MGKLRGFLNGQFFFPPHPDPAYMTRAEILDAIEEAEKNLVIARANEIKEAAVWYSQEINLLSAELARRNGFCF